MKFDILRALGWFENNPVNLSAEERGESGSVSPFLQNTTMQNYNAFTSPSKDLENNIREIKEMSSYELVAPIIETYAEEATQPDINRGLTVWYECDNKQVEDSLNKMLTRVGIEDAMMSIAYSIASHGNEFRRVHLGETEGVVGFINAPLDRMRRIYHQTTRRLLGFQWSGTEPPEGSALSVGNTEPIWAPWEFVHFRRLVPNEWAIDPEMGVGVMANFFPLYRRLKMSVDHMVVYRANMMPNRLKVEVGCGARNVAEAAEWLNEWRNLFVGMMAKSDGVMESRYDPMAMDSILFLPKFEGDDTSVDTMEGQSTVPDVYDIDLLTKMLFAAARMPRSYLGFAEDSNGLANASLVTQDIRFARQLRSVRRPIVAGFARLGQIHLAATGIDPAKYKVAVKMSKISVIEEELNTKILSDQVSLASSLMDIMKDLGMPEAEMAGVIFKDLLAGLSKHTDVARLCAAVATAARGGGMSKDLGFESIRNTPINRLLESKKPASNVLLERFKEAANELVSSIRDRRCSLVDTYNPWESELAQNPIPMARNGRTLSEAKDEFRKIVERLELNDIAITAPGSEHPEVERAKQMRRNAG